MGSMAVWWSPPPYHSRGRWKPLKFQLLHKDWSYCIDDQEVEISPKRPRLQRSGSNDTVDRLIGMIPKRQPLQCGRPYDIIVVRLVETIPEHWLLLHSEDCRSYLMSIHMRIDNNGEAEHHQSVGFGFVYGGFSLLSPFYIKFK